MLIVDGSTGFTGGIGISDLWAGDAQDPDHWRDTHFRVEGPVVASVLYLKRAVPGQLVRLSNRIAAMRRDLAWKWPEHDTSAWLHKIIAADLGEGVNQSLFETAFQLRRQYRPSE